MKAIFSRHLSAREYLIHFRQATQLVFDFLSMHNWAHILQCLDHGKSPHHHSSMFRNHHQPFLNPDFPLILSRGDKTINSYQLNSPYCRFPHSYFETGTKYLVGINFLKSLIGSLHPDINPGCQGYSPKYPWCCVDGIRTTKGSIRTLFLSFSSTRLRSSLRTKIVFILNHASSPESSFFLLLLCCFSGPETSQYCPLFLRIGFLHL